MSTWVRLKKLPTEVKIMKCKKCDGPLARRRGIDTDKRVWVEDGSYCYNRCEE